jgi:hypothetical protein
MTAAGARGAPKVRNGLACRGGSGWEGGAEDGAGVGWLGGEDQVDLRTSQPLIILAYFGRFSGYVIALGPAGWLPLVWVVSGGGVARAN